MSKDTKKVKGWASWKVQNPDVKAFVTETGGHLAPVTFDRQGAKIKPYSVSPWCKEKHSDEPPLLQVLRGDFFCLPFGGNETPHKGEEHPPHGETANSKWKFVELKKADTERILHLRLKTKVRKGSVDKFIRLVDGHNAVYSKHVLTGYEGRMDLGHHAILRFPDYEGSGLISTSNFVYGQVFVEPTEKPEDKGYSILAPGTEFDSLDKVKTITGEFTDLSRYPARRGFEDIVIMVTDPTLEFAWTAVSFPKERYVWFGLKDPKVLASTLFWISNGGRHFPPWNGRHVNVMGLEEITGYFHCGLHESVSNNPLSDKGYKTALELSPDSPTTVNYIMACVPAPAGFDRVNSIEADGKSGVTLSDAGGKTIKVPLDLPFLKA